MNVFYHIIFFHKDMNMFMRDALHIILNIIKEGGVSKCISFVCAWNGKVCDLVAITVTWPALHSFRIGGKIRCDVSFLPPEPGDGGRCVSRPTRWQAAGNDALLRDTIRLM